MPTVVVLPVPLTPTIEHDCAAAAATAIGSSDRREDAADLLLDEIAQALAAARRLLHRRDDPIGRRHADVGRDQQLFERVERLDVDRPRSALRLVGAADDLVEALDDLLFGAGQALADAAEDPHPGDLTEVGR